jgi:hypothetical protein
MVQINTSPDAIVDSTVNNPSTRRREDTMCGFKVGLASEILNVRHSPTALVRGNYLTAVVSRVDSFWVDDHLDCLTLPCTAGLNCSRALMPRAIATPAIPRRSEPETEDRRLLEPWTMPGHTAARNRLARSRLGVGVTDACRGRFGVVTPPAFHAIGRCPTERLREPVNEGVYPS